METQEYSNRELDARFDVVMEKLEEIHTQTKLTNGRTGSLERWRSYMLGGMSILAMIVVPISLYLLYSQLK